MGNWFSFHSFRSKSKHLGISEKIAEIPQNHRFHNDFVGSNAEGYREGDVSVVFLGQSKSNFIGNCYRHNIFRLGIIKLAEMS